jgi:hypothetical protein
MHTAHIDRKPADLLCYPLPATLAELHMQAVPPCQLDRQLILATKSKGIVEGVFSPAVHVYQFPTDL